MTLRCAGAEAERCYRSQFFVNLLTVNMFRIVWWCVLLHTVFGQSGFGFGTSYLKNSRLCHQWVCVNENLGFPDNLPPKDQFVIVLKSLLPDGSWQQVADQVADKCYGDRPRRYTNTCPGQALMQCTVDHLIQLCPDESLRKDDACAPLTSLAGFKYMFSQSRYRDLEKNLPSERRPAWFLKNYFNSKCCNLPELFNSTMLQGCGFENIVHYHNHEARYENVVSFPGFKKQITTPKSYSEQVKIVDIGLNNTGKVSEDDLTVVNLDGTVPNMDLDPLDCCDMSGFIEPSWRTGCDFRMTWNERYRLTVQNDSEQGTTSTVAPSTFTRPRWSDVKIVPQPCEKVNCVFRKLNIVSEVGSVDLDAFSKLLDNFTSDHSSWTKAKARVVTKCLSKPIKDYTDDCEINRLLTCTFDILSENCPKTKKNDPCKHSTILKKDITCQISASKLRPKNRRQYCNVPSLVNRQILSQCGLTSLTRMEQVADPVTTKPRTHWWTSSKFACESTTLSTKCLLSKMGVLNKYGFMDYFSMKDKIRKFTSQKPEWSALTDVYLSTFTSIPMYGQQCSTTKKFLNVVDAMLMTCPISKRKISLQCNRILTDMAATAPAGKISFNKARLNHDHDHLPLPSIYREKIPLFPKRTVTQKTPAYDFGILNSNDAPKVEIIDLKPTTTWKPLILTPVYMRMAGKLPNRLTAPFPVRPYDGIMRGARIAPYQPQMPDFPAIIH